MPFELTIHEGDGPGRRQVLAKDVVFVGRREDNDVVLPHSFVSSRHGRLFRREGSVLVEDMGSTNGTLVNGEPLTPMVARALEPHDRVQIGEIAILASWRDDAVANDREALTYHELPRQAAIVPDPRSAPPPLPVPAPAPPAPPPSPDEVALAPPVRVAPAPRREGAALSDVQKAAHLGQTSLSAALVTSRPLPRGETPEADRYLKWEIFFKTVGLLAILGGLILLVFVLVA